ncbi:hypothetical protein ACSQ76_20475 [Roseovarius sp. B08]
MTPRTDPPLARSTAHPAPATDAGLKVHTQFLPADRATQILLQQFV